MQNINWTQVLVFGLVVLVVFALGIAALFLVFGGGRGMMGPGGMRGGWCPWCGTTGPVGIGWLVIILGLTLACLLPLGLLALLVVGAIWLSRNRGEGSPR
jgi:hypothetical protein